MIIVAMGDALCQRMREDWNERARSDAKYYVAYGRRNQDDEEFFASGSEITRGIKGQFLRLPPRPAPRCRRALEIGCGLGRLMRPLSAHVGEIHGIDISDEMVRGARERLRGIPNAHVHHSEGGDLAGFAAESFDLVYSYAVFQHIPSREVIFHYLREACRVLAPGGVFWFQANGLPGVTQDADTWRGARISGREVAEFAREAGMLLKAVEAVETKYMTVTLQKPRRPAPPPAGPPRIRRITDAHSSVPVVPARGRWAFASLWIERLPADSDLNTLEVTVGQAPARGLYLGPFLGPPGDDDLQQFNVQLPPGIEPGLQPVEVLYRGEPLAPPSFLRVIPPGPTIPRLVRVSDAIDLLSAERIACGSVKALLEEVADASQFQATVDGCPVREVDSQCIDPVPQLFEVTFPLPAGIGAGPHRLELELGSRRFPPVTIEVVGAAP
jgi:SAM-dependent methyltransferase